MISKTDTVFSDRRREAHCERHPPAVFQNFPFSYVERPTRFLRQSRGKDLRQKREMGHIWRCVQAAVERSAREIRLNPEVDSLLHLYYFRRFFQSLQLLPGLHSTRDSYPSLRALNFRDIAKRAFYQILSHSLWVGMECQNHQITAQIQALLSVGYTKRDFCDWCATPSDLLRCLQLGIIDTETTNSQGQTPIELAFAYGEGDEPLAKESLAHLFEWLKFYRSALSPQEWQERVRALLLRSCDVGDGLYFYHIIRKLRDLGCPMRDVSHWYQEGDVILWERNCRYAMHLFYEMRNYSMLFMRLSFDINFPKGDEWVMEKGPWRGDSQWAAYVQRRFSAYLASDHLDYGKFPPFHRCGLTGRDFARWYAEIETVTDCMRKVLWSLYQDGYFNGYEQSLLEALVQKNQFEEATQIFNATEPELDFPEAGTENQKFQLMLNIYRKNNRKFSIFYPKNPQSWNFFLKDSEGNSIFSFLGQFSCKGFCASERLFDNILLTFTQELQTEELAIEALAKKSVSEMYFWNALCLHSSYTEGDPFDLSEWLKKAKIFRKQFFEEEKFKFALFLIEKKAASVPEKLMQQLGASGINFRGILELIFIYINEMDMSRYDYILSNKIIDMIYNFSICVSDCTTIALQYPALWEGLRIACIRKNYVIDFLRLIDAIRDPRIYRKEKIEYVEILRRVEREQPEGVVIPLPMLSFQESLFMCLTPDAEEREGIFNALFGVEIGYLSKIKQKISQNELDKFLREHAIADTDFDQLIVQLDEILPAHPHRTAFSTMIDMIRMRTPVIGGPPEADEVKFHTFYRKMIDRMRFITYRFTDENAPLSMSQKQIAFHTLTEAANYCPSAWGDAIDKVVNGICGGSMEIAVTLEELTMQSVHALVLEMEGELLKKYRESNPQYSDPSMEVHIANHIQWTLYGLHGPNGYPKNFVAEAESMLQIPFFTPVGSELDIKIEIWQMFSDKYSPNAIVQKVLERIGRDQNYASLIYDRIGELAKRWREPQHPRGQKSGDVEQLSYDTFMGITCPEDMDYVPDPVVIVKLLVEMEILRAPFPTFDASFKSASERGIS